ncbi:AFR258Wp [Eremothecium gossypii ATCC 10895]|uniref:Proteasome subunit beta n=1 Tax=Eremothecium gossypii (strain ATCC 10895 / CBS 109.51 / FGSC 9923 / NRRL Y-1056) TaxID=284811 RepID=Q753R8_EREGS|nr:AFR258Wp [Eremothecium gossypii ATCC 10895]AAS53629.1 AFR258Wp [Eremothecium gossypii ATCC 10895]AEY97942.1 FAFR258Wp [Eremothecium gossypii FDAG1]
MNHDPFEWGRPLDSHYGAYNAAIANAGPSQHTQQPIVTGTSVIAMKYNNGTIIAADRLGSYGSLLRFTDMDRLFAVGESTVVGVSGDVSDMQYLQRLLQDMEIENNYDNSHADGAEALKPSYIFEYLASLMYQRRSKLNPLWNAIIVAGVEDGQAFLRYVDLKGVKYSAPSLATGFGAHMAIPLMRKVADAEKDVAGVDLSIARATILESMKVLFYRDARSSRRFSLAIIDNDAGVSMEQLEVENMTWGFAKDIRGYGTQNV